MIFDTHAHYDDKVFDEDRKELLSSLHNEGVDLIVNIGASMQTSENTFKLAEEYSFVYGAVGVHPDEAKELDDKKLDKLRVMSNHSKIVAIGEIGLDYYWDSTPRAEQQKWFERQMELAREVNLPMVIHSREAAKDTLDMVKSMNGGDIGGVIHCFSYGVEMAREFLNMGFYLGIGGVVTFQNAKKLKEVVEYMPMSQLVLETDCPYLAPAPFRGKRNASGYLTYVAEAIAQIKGISAAEVYRITMENGKRMYRI